MGKKEAQARIKINNLLQKSGWRFFDDDNGKANIALEINVKLTEQKLNEFGENFEKAKNGFIDFLLLDSKGFPLVVLEAKSEDKNPLNGKEQARKYANSLFIRYVILSNGNLHYFWDLERGNPEIVTTLPTPESLVEYSKYKPNPQSLVNEVVNNDYIVLTQKPDYSIDPRWKDKDFSNDFIRDFKLKFLRKYQVKAIKAIQEAVRQGSTRFLFEMATGTGKTLVAGAVIKLFLRTSNAKRVLFLVDRIELEDQAWKNFVNYLKNDFKTVIYKEQKDDWRKAEIVVSTVQSLLFNNKYKSLFSPTDFDLIISDEAHRSVGGNSRALFEYFVGYKLGLTATPKDYLKNVNESKLRQDDPRNLEKRILLDTYKTFGCESGNPTYRYTLINGVTDGYLVNPVVVDARTEITTQLLSDEGFSVIFTAVDEDGKNTEEEVTYLKRDFEKKFASEETNLAFCQTFIENALLDPINNEIGKTIIYCVSQNHASKITQILNKLADIYFPNKYKSDFAVQITSSIPDAQQFTLNFSNNCLNGHSNFFDGYKSSKTRIAVTVGMMTTGYDCEDILNLCLMRPIFSPTEFVQMKGRGTRMFDFIFKTKDESGNEETTKVKKEKYYLFDFFANYEYFEEKYDYGQILKIPPKTVSKRPVEIPTPISYEYENTDVDPMKFMEKKPIGLEGMKIDRMLYENFEERIKKDVYAKEQFDQGNIEAVEKYIREELFNKPEDYLDLEKLRKAIKIDRRISLREIIEKIFGRITRFKSKDELLNEEFDSFVTIYKPDNKYIIPIKNFFKSYITDEDIRKIIESGEFSRLAVSHIREDYKALSPHWRKIIPEYIKDYVIINKFMS